MATTLSELLLPHGISLGYMRPEPIVTSRGVADLPQEDGRYFMPVRLDFRVTDPHCLNGAYTTARSLGAIDERKLFMYTSSLVIYFHPGRELLHCAMQGRSFLEYWGRKIESIVIGPARPLCAPNSPYHTRAEDEVASKEDQEFMDAAMVRRIKSSYMGW